MIIRQMHLAGYKWPEKYAVLNTTQCHRCLKLREHAIGMLNAGMSTRAVSREFNVNCSTISCLQHHFREFGNMTNRLHICNHASPVRIRLLHLRARLRPATWTADESVWVCTTKEFLQKVSETVSSSSPES